MKATWQPGEQGKTQGAKHKGWLATSVWQTENRHTERNRTGTDSDRFVCHLYKYIGMC